jgi:DNA-binding SARP family transcriptional activator
VGKVTRPTLPEVYARENLFKTLDRLRQQPVIWISGPGGSGKTTLVSSYLDSRNLSCLWYQLDEGDKDPATFFYYLSKAAKKAFSHKKSSLPLFTPHFTRGLPAFTQWYFEKLFDGFEPPLALVFDNFHEVPEENHLSEVILHSLSRIPDKVNLILLSRSEPPAALIQLQANGQMEVLGWSDLRLSLSEAEGIIRLRNPEIRSQEVIRMLHGASDGWTAGLVLMLQKAQREGVAVEILKNLGKEEIFSYFTSQILKRTDSAMQEFLLQTALFPKMTVPMAEELTGMSSAGQFLSTLNRANFFTERRLEKNPVYQYHPLFREFLLSQGSKFYSQEKLTEKIRKASSCLEKNNMAEDALRLVLEIQDWEKALPFVLKHAPVLDSQGRHILLEGWISSFPQEIRENHPWLLYWLGITRLLFTPSLAKSYFEKSFNRFREQNDLPGVLFSANRLLVSIEYEGVNYGLMQKPLAVLQEIAEEKKGGLTPEDEFLLSLDIFWGMFYSQPQNPKIEYWAEKTLFLLEAAPYSYLKAMALSILTYYRLYSGDFQKATRPFLLYQEFLHSQDAPLITRIRGRELEVIYLLFMGQLEQGMRVVYESLELSRATGARLAAARILGHGAVISMGLGDFEAAQHFLEEMALTLETTNPVNISFYHMGKSLLSLHLGDPAQALFHIDLVLKMALESNNIWWQLSSQHGKAHILQRLGKQKEAARHLGKVLAQAKQIRSRYWEFVACLAQALFSFDRGKEKEGIQKLHKALAMGREGNYTPSWLFNPTGFSQGYAKALEFEIEPDYVREIIRRSRMIPNEISSYSEKWPFPLQIITLGRFEVIKDGKTLRFPRKAQQKPLALLKVLIALGGKKINEEQIADILWPEADGDDAYHSLVTNLHRLRQLLGREEALLVSEGRLTLNAQCCWVDLWAFEKFLEMAEAERNSGSPDRAIGWIEKTLPLYKGPFLQGEMENPWVISPRERVKIKFLRASIWLGSQRQKSRQWEKAIEAYLEGLEIDDLSEELYRELMICYQSLGRRSEAISVYHRCRKTLNAALGIEPSPRTEEIYSSNLANIKR